MSKNTGVSYLLPAGGFLLRSSVEGSFPLEGARVGDGGIRLVGLHPEGLSPVDEVMDSWWVTGCGCPLWLGVGSRPLKGSGVGYRGIWFVSLHFDRPITGVGG